METKLIKFYEGRFNAELSYAEKDLASYNSLLKAIAPFAKNVGLSLDKETVSELLRDAKSHAFDNLVAGAPLTIAGVTVSRKKAIDLIEIPDDWQKIIDQVDVFTAQNAKQSFHEFPGGFGSTRFDKIGIGQFDIVNGAFVLSDQFLNALKQKHSSYTRTEKQNKALAAIENIQKSLIVINDLTNIVGSATTLLSLGIDISRGEKGQLIIGGDPSGFIHTYVK